MLNRGLKVSGVVAQHDSLYVSMAGVGLMRLSGVYDTNEYQGTLQVDALSYPRSTII